MLVLSKMYLNLWFWIFLGPAFHISSSEVVQTKIEDVLSHYSTASVSAKFAHFSLIRPSYFYSRTRREVASTLVDENSLEHINYLTVKYSINNTFYILDLILNRELLSSTYFEKHQHNGAHVIRNRTNTKDIELCHYKGVLRGVPESWAAVSTCDNILRGVVYDGLELTYIEPLQYNRSLNSVDSPNSHIVYKATDYLNQDQHKCGYSSRHEKTRLRRNTLSKHDTIRGPYNANDRSRYLELMLVVDNRLYNLLNKDLKHVYRHCKDIVNVINSLYEKLNIFVALVGVVVWREYDEIAFNVNGDITLTNFLTYRRERLVKDHPNDNAQLLTAMTFENGVVGKALKGPICTYEFSGGINVDHGNPAGLVATTVAHEMGHNLGMEHDTAECKCPGDRCIMAPSSSSVSPTDWSSCSMEYLAFSFDHGMDYCMRNKPKALFDGPVCGNGFVEDGEECDSGLAENFKNNCCDAATCTLHMNATCATGSCCNLETCTPHPAGKLCRSADRECDLSEFCRGDSEYCPDDVFKLDGETCKGSEAFCYEGSCRTHSDQCRLLWGPSGTSSDKQCFGLNTGGNRRGNCGYNKMNQSYSKCNDDDVLCGMLHCQHLSEKLEFGIETVAMLSHSFINLGGSITPCRSAIVDMGLNQVDPGLSPDGARCGDEKLCVNRKCMSVAALRASMPVSACPFNCHDQGVCNNRGHCHCNTGFAPPFCEYPGAGGSSDSGPASDPNGSRIFITLFYTLAVAVVPLSVLILCLKYYNAHPKSFWWKRPGVSRLGDKKKSTATPGMQNSNLGNSGGCGGQLLLPGEGQNYNLIGAKTYKTDILSPSRSAPLKPTPPKLPSDVHLPTRAAPKIPSTSARLSENFSDYAVNIPPELPPANKSLSRPLISAPVLSDTTSQTARNLIENPVASQHFYLVPMTSGNSVSNNPFVLHDNANKTSNAEVHNGKSATLPPVHTESNAAPRSTNPGIYTLNLITSFMSNKSTRRKSIKNLTAPLQGSQDSVRSLEISQPVLQSGDSIPLSKLNTNDLIKRTQSMRETDTNIKRPNLPAFGSMRTKRPASLAGCQRPTQPPPPAPSGISSLPSYQNPASPAATSPANLNTASAVAKPTNYDDCLNTLSDSLAALENAAKNPTDNIYAVIEESPPPSRSFPETLGLLGEIVCEIQARNTESIYSMDSNKLYMNTRGLNNPSPDPTIKSTTSSGYLSPINGINDSISDFSRTADSSTYRLTSSSSANVPSPSVNHSHNVPATSNSYVNTSVNNSFTSKPSTSVNSSSSPSVKPLVSSLHLHKTNSVSNVSSGKSITSNHPASVPTRPTSLAGFKSSSITKSLVTKKPELTKSESASSESGTVQSPSSLSTKPIPDTVVARKPAVTTAGYKLVLSRGPMSGNTVSSYTIPIDKPSVKPSLPVTSGVSSMLSKPVIPQRPASSVLKRPDLISNLSGGNSNVAKSPDVVNKGKNNVASLQHKFETH